MGFRIRVCAWEVCKNMHLISEAPTISIVKTPISGDSHIHVRTPQCLHTHSNNRRCRDYKVYGSRLKRAIPGFYWDCILEDLQRLGRLLLQKPAKLALGAWGLRLCSAGSGCWGAGSRLSCGAEF